jgi:DNA-binding beta-propeller fold protein YncE
VFDGDGAFVAAFAAPGPAGTSVVLEGVDVTGGRVLVTAYEDGQVLVVPVDPADPTTPLGDDWPVLAGEPGTGEGQFAAPVDLAVTPAGELVVTDQRSNRVQVFVAP